jgi:hypothetical protein
MEKAVYARLKIVEEASITIPTTMILDLLMCASGLSYFCDPSRTMDVLRPCLEAVRMGTF